MTKHQYLLKIAAHFPDIAYTDVRFIRRGWDNDVLILDRRLVFRFPKRPEFVERFKAEVRLLQHMRGRFAIGVPTYDYLPEDLSFGGYHIIPGRPLRRSMFNKLNASTRKNIAGDLARFLTVMHAIPVPVARGLGVGELQGGHWASKSNTESRFETMKDVLFPKLNAEERTWLAAHYGRYLSLDFDFALKVVHNDLTDDHIYLVPERGSLGGIIDFADVEITDPAMDFAGLWLYGEPFVRDVLDRYGHDIDGDLLDRSKLPYRVHTAEKMLELLQGMPSAVPHTFDTLRKQLNRAMVLFAD